MPKPGTDATDPGSELLETEAVLAADQVLAADPILNCDEVLDSEPFDASGGGGTGSRRDDWVLTFSGTYAVALNTVVSKLRRQVNFGRPELKQDLKGADTRYWTWAPDLDPYGKKLVGNDSGQASPSKTFKALVDEANAKQLWSLDCAQWVQVVLLCSRLLIWKSEKFDSRLKGKVEIREGDSEGLACNEQWLCEGPGGTVKRRNGKECKGITMDQVLANAPVGTRVMWTSYFLKNPEKSEAEQPIEMNLNTVKLGNDCFGAHIGSKNPVNVFSRKQIEDHLLEVTERREGKSSTKGPEGTDKETLRSGIYLSDVQTFVTT